MWGEMCPTTCCWSVPQSRRFFLVMKQVVNSTPCVTAATILRVYICDFKHRRTGILYLRVISFFFAFPVCLAQALALCGPGDEAVAVGLVEEALPDALASDDGPEAGAPAVLRKVTLSRRILR